MPKAFLMDTGLRNSLINNFQAVSIRSDRGDLWEQSFFRLLADQNPIDELRYWRTADGKEVDFVLPETENPIAYEAKFDIKN